MEWTSNQGPHFLWQFGKGKCKSENGIPDVSDFGVGGKKPNNVSAVIVLLLAVIVYKP